MGIGGEYAAINSAIDELIPARLRGRVDLTINGSYWVGASVGALLTVPLLNTSIFAEDFGWRLAFLIGAVLGVGILIVRRHVPESPRWLFIHGKNDEAEQIVGEIEEEVEADTGEKLSEVSDDEKLTIHQRATIPFREIAAGRLQEVPEADDPRALAVRRPGLPLQRRHLRPRHDPGRILRRRLRPGPALHRRLRRLQLHRPAHPRPALRHGRAQSR